MVKELVWIQEDKTEILDNGGYTSIDNLLKVYPHLRRPPFESILIELGITDFNKISIDLVEEILLRTNRPLSKSPKIVMERNGNKVVFFARRSQLVLRDNSNL